MREKRNLAIASLAQTLAIILGRAPDQLITSIDSHTSVFDSVSNALWGNIAYAIHLCNMLNFVVDPIMTLIIVKPYREAIGAFLLKSVKWVKIRGVNRVLPLYSADHVPEDVK